MGVSRRWAMFAAGAAHVLVIEVPGEWVLRAAVEQAVLDRGWRLATAPAEADVLAVCGAPGPELDAVVRRLWDQLPGPRVRVDLPDREALSSGFERAVRGLVDTASQREDARQRPASPNVEPDHGDMDHGDMDHGDHGDMDHGDMEMAPGGIPLAEGGPDRDGLEMDVLHLSLGPGLPHWPAGLVMRCALQGDVIVEATCRLLDGGRGADAPAPGDGTTRPQLPVARQADLVLDVLALVGWPAGVSAARQVRDQLLNVVDDRDLAAAQARLARLERRVRRSLVLRSSLRGIGTVTSGELDRRGLPDTLLGDVRDRLLSALDRVSRQEEGHADGATAESVLLALPELVTGLDLAAARLVVASVGLETSLALREAAHG